MQRDCDIQDGVGFDLKLGNWLRAFPVVGDKRLNYRKSISTPSSESPSESSQEKKDVHVGFEMNLFSSNHVGSESSCEKSASEDNLILVLKPKQQLAMEVREVH